MLNNCLLLLCRWLVRLKKDLWNVRVLFVPQPVNLHRVALFHLLWVQIEESDSDKVTVLFAVRNSLWALGNCDDLVACIAASRLYDGLGLSTYWKPLARIWSHPWKHFHFLHTTHAGYLEKFDCPLVTHDEERISLYPEDKRRALVKSI